MFNQRCSKEVIYCRSTMGFGWFRAGLEFSCVVLGDSECLWRHLGSYWVRPGGVLGWFWGLLERILVEKKCPWWYYRLGVEEIVYQIRCSWLVVLNICCVLWG